MSLFATFYQDEGYGGQSAVLEAGRWDLGPLRGKVTAIKVPPGLKVTLLDSLGSAFPYGLGVYTSDVYNVGDQLNDKAGYALIEDVYAAAPNGAPEPENGYLFDLGFWWRPVNNAGAPLTPAAQALFTAAPAFRAGQTSGAPREQNPYGWPIGGFPDAAKARDWARGWDDAAAQRSGSGSVAYLAGAVAQQRGIARTTDPYGAPTSATVTADRGKWILGLLGGGLGYLFGKAQGQKDALRQMYARRRTRRF